MKKFVVSVDLGGTKISAALADGKGNILLQKTVPTEASSGLNHVVKRLENAILSVLSDAGHSVSDIKCIGIGAPGPVISEKGIIVDPPNLPGWKRVSLRKIISRRFGRKVMLENDANCAALAELKFGAGKKFGNFVYVTISTGIGGGIIIDRKLYRGSGGSAGEIGHTVIDINGPVCSCGKKGHLEGMAAGPAIKKRTGKSPEIISELAKKGDRKALTEVKLVGRYVGIGFSNLVNILNPEAIIVGGGISNFGKPLFDSIRETIKINALTDVKVIPSKFKDNIGLLGAVALCL